MELSSALALVLSLLASFAAATSGAVFRPGAWYERLRKPSWTPPNWAFPIVWTLLYSAMALAAWLVWEAAGPAAWFPLVVYGFHLLVNAGWSALFFGLRRLDWAMAEVVLLWVAIAATMALFAPVDARAAWLLAPYLAWVSLAAVLNLRLLQLNGARGPARA